MKGFFTIREKTGFSSLEPIRILRDGGLFYVRESPKGKLQRFNLPPGTYYTPREIKQLKKPLKQSVRLPRPEVTDFDQAPTRVKIIFESNPNKASIFVHGGLMRIDPAFLKVPVVSLFVVLHELGHYYYRGNGQISEQKCDQYATAKMLEMGYNKSQIEACAKTALGKDNKRTHICSNNLKKA